MSKNDPRLSKAEVQKVIAYCLQLIEWNRTGPQITQAIMEEFRMSQSNAYKYYQKATAQLRSANDEVVEVIRDKRISSTTKDIQEAYENYKNAEDALIAHKWYDLYSKLKLAQDKYYSNALEPQAEKEAFKVNITYSPAIKKSESSDEE